MQTRDHIIHECPRYNGHRDGLCKVSRDVYLPDILGMKRGIEALAVFLEKSGAFTKTGTPKRPPMRPTLDDEETMLEDWLGDQDPENNQGTRSMHTNPCPIA
ncbi:uncharacterized protein EV420DRAFT_1535614 [Desarmillaria tabescens]|uniref:Uncharacterized protein n=1 Tax=Armillaria tabescens TaxID=1929756 RepID=A0AA39KFQ7_ARMTA|nr:uncharacterized protein EV420DRAFT_1535614 [Desarmillaria tabescens]KAK0460197.1 hypothetical protein EV420DRAFT_1535614 [Desarmillaria tabescens]